MTVKLRDGDRVKQAAMAWARMPTREINDRLSVHVRRRSAGVTIREGRLIRAAMLWILGADKPGDVPLQND